MSGLIRYRLSETVWRVWHKDRPDMSFTVDTHVGLCTCIEGRSGPPPGFGCIHVELNEAYLEAKGLPKIKAREVARDILKTLKSDAFVRSAKVLGVTESRGLVTHIRFDVAFRGKGHPLTFEGRWCGINLSFRTTFQINQSGPFASKRKATDWERIF